MEGIFRIQAIHIRNFKNVLEGSIVMSKYSKEKVYDNHSTITGIYGQNGSGKTVLIESIIIFQRIIRGRMLPEDIEKYIAIDKEMMELSLELYIEQGHERYIITYEIVISKVSNKGSNREYGVGEGNKAYISRERIILSYYDGGTWHRKSKLIEKHGDDREIEKNGNITSLIFQNDMNQYEKLYEKKPVMKEVLQLLREFGENKLIILDKSQFGLIDLRGGGLQIDITKKNKLSQEDYDTLNKVIEQCDMIISKVIPGIHVELLPEECAKEDIILFAFGTRRGSESIPMYCESSGVKKLITLISSFIAIYNNSSLCLVVDELDAGIYEYLLGEVLEVLQRNGRGQLIFTSHNLRPLEVLENSSLVFTTTNKERRYVPLKQVKATQNKRHAYLRAIVLGGQEEALYEQTNGYEIETAFRRAGRKL
jgi:AAA15 family ATPase/GTPase